VTERKVSKIDVNVEHNTMTSSFYLQSHAPEIFSAIIREFAGSDVISSVPVITNVGFVMVESLLQVPIHLLLASN
jgi:hypothetical protein